MPVGGGGGGGGGFQVPRIPRPRYRYRVARLRDNVFNLVATYALIAIV